MSKRSHILITVFIALLILMVMLIVAIIRDQSATELVTSLELPSTVQLKMKLQQNLYALVASVTLTVLFMITWILFHKSDDIAATPKKRFWAKIRRKQYNSYADGYKVRQFKKTRHANKRVLEMSSQFLQIRRRIVHHLPKLSNRSQSQNHLRPRTQHIVRFRQVHPDGLLGFAQRLNHGLSQGQP